MIVMMIGGPGDGGETMRTVQLRWEETGELGQAVALIVGGEIGDGAGLCTFPVPRVIYKMTAHSMSFGGLFETIRKSRSFYEKSR